MTRFAGNHLKHFLLPALLTTVALSAPPDRAIAAVPADANVIQQKLESILSHLDSPGYADEVSDGEHIVLAYQLAQGRIPTRLEYFTLSSLRQDIGFPRSAVLTMAVSGKQKQPSWAQCRRFVDHVRASDFRSNARAAATAHRLAQSSLGEILTELAAMADDHEPRHSGHAAPAATQDAPYKAYDIYFGYLHAHSELSDGQGDPRFAYAYARDAGGLDFFSLTDHGELLRFWPWDNKWQRLKEAAELEYIPHEYATLWGFEWSNPLLGHINVLNTDDFTDAIFSFWIYDFYDWIIARPEAFSRFNHPGEYDFLFLEFLHLRLYPGLLSQMVGIENWNGNSGFGTYYYGFSYWGSLVPYGFWDAGNSRGWHLGSLGGQDNHSQNWGTMNQFRTAVLADELTRESITDAYRARRFYATEDRDLRVDFRCQGYPMGSRIAGVVRDFEVIASDDSGDTFQEVLLYRDGNLIERQAVTGSEITVQLSDSGATGSSYYYVILRQNDDSDGNGRNDEAIVSPIWID